MAQHTLPARKSVSCPVDHIFVDCETTRTQTSDKDIHEHTFRLGCARYFNLRQGQPYRQDSLQFTRPRQFWKWLATKQMKKRVLWLWAHNAAFDITLLDFWHMAEDGQVQIKFLVQDSPPTIVRFVYNNCVVVLADTMNYYPRSLADLGAALGLEKMDMPSWEAPEADWFRYCMRDVAICEKFVLSLCQFNIQHQLGQLKPTAAGSAWSAFMTRFQDCEIIATDGDHIRDSEAAAYFGGRVDNQFIGNVFAGISYLEPEINAERQYPSLHLVEQVHRVDCNSLYPSVMRANDYPVRYIDMQPGLSLKALERCLADYEAISMVRIETKNHQYPVRDNNRVQYAVGSFTCTLAGPELRQALKHGEIKRVHWVQRYERGKPFTSFVDFFYSWKEKETKREDNDGMAKVAKMFLNSLYGKFAQRLHSWNPGNKLGPMPWGTWYERDPKTAKPVKWRAMAWYAEFQDQVRWWKHAMPAISAYVTSYGRVKMQNAKDIIGDRQYLYSDTDSYHVTQAGYRNMVQAGLIHPTELGKFRLEDSATQVLYRGAKDYVWGGKTVVSGLPRDWEDCGHGIYRVTKFDGLSTILNRQGEAKINEYRESYVPKREYEYGQVEDSGWTKPWHKWEEAPF